MSPFFGTNFSTNFISNFGTDSGSNYTTQLAPLPPTITPADSDCEETPAATEPKSFFSPYSSPPSNSMTPTSPRLGAIHSSQSTQEFPTEEFPNFFHPDNDHEMEDSIHLSPGSFQNDPSMTITGRIPTPIHSQFSTFVRSEKTTRRHDTGSFSEDEAMVDSFMRSRRLPSPISEGEASPAGIVAGFGDMQMDIERETPTKKGHQRSKHSLRSWTGLGEMNGHSTGMKRSFTMGYRADCEKCRNKVPGHFSHIITY